MPVIAFGTGSKWKGQDVTDYVIQAIETGFSHLDTAQWYQTEDSVGRAIRDTGLDRTELFITTKWSGLTTIPEAINHSLEQIGVKQVDLYLIHNPAVIKGSVEDVWREFEAIKESGLAKSIGVSNFNLKQLQDLVKVAKVKPAVNQIFFHPYNYAEHKELLEFSAKHGIVTEAYSSLAPITRYPGGAVDKPVQAAAKRLNATPTQVILSWVKAKGVVIVTTSSTKAHLQEYLDVADLSPLTDEEIAAIDEAGAKGPPNAMMTSLSRKRHFLALAVLFQLLFLLYRTW
ncbi:Aldo/keto reductase [Daedaleopsis nitida]|nr:Aldo/keto reductase [Daedaleopsis nitida]